MTPSVGLALWYPFVIGALNLYIGAYIFRRGPRSPLNRSFAFFAGSLALWTGSRAIGQLYPAYYVSALRAAFAAASLAPMGVLVFAEVFPAKKAKDRFR